MKRLALAALAFALACATAIAGPTDDIAEALVVAAAKPITPDSLPADFARLTRFVRHDGNSMVLFTDGGATDGYVRHAQAHFDTAPAAIAPGGMNPLFMIAFEFADEPEFTFAGLAAALEKLLGTPSGSSNQSGSTFRTWRLQQPEGRMMTIGRAQASDNGDPVTIVQLIQQR